MSIKRSAKLVTILLGKKAHHPRCPNSAISSKTGTIVTAYIAKDGTPEYQIEVDGTLYRTSLVGGYDWRLVEKTSSCAKGNGVHEFSSINEFDISMCKKCGEPE